jgi:hypothetical protein
MSGHKRSDYDQCLKLDALGNYHAKLAPVQAELRAKQEASDTFKDCCSSLFRDSSIAPVSFKSVYFSKEHKCWKPSRRFCLVSYHRLYTTLNRGDLTIRWRNAYEVLLEDRCRHLYFDLEEMHPASSSIQTHDKLCWHRLQMLVMCIKEVMM